MRLVRIIRTVVHLKAIQIMNRVWRVVVAKVGRMEDLLRTCQVECSGATARTGFPVFSRCWNGDATFTFLNETHELKESTDWNNANWKKLWLYNLHYFDCLRQSPDVGCRLSDVCCLEQALIDRWIAENPVGKGNGWEPYPISLRVVNWIKWMLRVRGGAAGVSVLQSLFVQVRWLRRQLEYHLLANHLLANAKALVFAGKFFKGDEAAEWYRKGMAIYRKELPEQVLDDGVHFERSAMYHVIMLEDILDCYNFTGEEIFREYAAKMLGALRLLVGPDGKIIKFNDAAEGIALPVERVREYAKRLGVVGSAETSESVSRPYRVERQSGFVRLEKGEVCVIAKMGEIGPSYQPGHAHADTGTFEMWKGVRKIISDTGTDRYAVDEERKRQRGTAAHNCVMIDGQNSSEVWAGHRVARRCLGVWKLGRLDGLNCAACEYRDYHGFRVRRTLEVTETGLLGVDEICGKGAHDIELRWHLAPSVRLGDVQVRVETRHTCCKLPTEVLPCLICEEFGRQIESQVIVWRGRMSLPTTIEWGIVV